MSNEEERRSKTTHGSQAENFYGRRTSLSVLLPLKDTTEPKD